MGLGDVKMLAMIGAFLGWQQVLVVLFLASVAGAVVGLTLAAIRGRTLASKLPFGTFLALGAYAASLWAKDSSLGTQTSTGDGYDDYDSRPLISEPARSAPLAAAGPLIP